MTAHKSFGLALLAASSTLALAASPAFAQTRAPSPQPSTQNNVRPNARANVRDDPLAEEEAIVVTGQRERGAVIGDVKPIQQFNSGDIRALGVSNVNELLSELGPQLQSASGKPPVMLLEGHRMSSPLEIASLPSEAIARVDVLPEEVGLRYGYDADQKVINIVLRERFRAFTGEVNGRVPTAGGALGGTVEGTFLSIRNGRRLNIGAELRGQESLFETERGLTGSDSAYRTLLPANRQLTINTTYNLPLAERVAATLNGQVVTDQSKAAIGRPYSTLLDSYFTGQTLDPLARTSSRLTTHLGFTVAKDHAKGQLTLTGNYDHAFSRSITDRAFLLGDAALAASSGDPAPDVTATPGTYLIDPAADLARSYTDTGSLDLLYSTALAKLPSGEITTTGHLTGSTQSFRSSRRQGIVQTPAHVSRTSGGASINLNIPLIGQGMAISDTIGRLSANFDASINELSDAGTIHSYSGGFNWQPAKTLSFTGNYTVRQTAPTAQQLGDAAVVTANVPIFDYVRGETARVTTTSGGNPNLAKAEVHSFRIGASISPLKDPQVNIQVDLSQNRTKGGIASLPGVTADAETGFPSRFTRNGSGVLTAVDLRPVNIREQKSTQLRWGINFNMQLKTPQSEIRAYQDVISKRIQERVASGQIPADVAARLTQALRSGQLGNFGQRPPGGTPQQGNAQAGGAQPGTGQAQGSPAQQGAGAQQGSTPQQGGTPQAGGEGQPTIVVMGNPDGGAAPPPGGGTFVFGGPGGPGGNFQPPPGGFRGPPGGFGGFGGGGGFGGFGGGGGNGGPPRGGRLNFSFYHTWVLESTAQLAAGLPVIDQLNGGTLGGGAGPSQHQLQIQAGYTQSGLGFRLFTNWNSATRSVGIAGTPQTNLRFGTLTTVNFRVFLNFAQMPKLVDKMPFLRGARLTFGANNLFDEKQKVTDGTGATPYAYQAAFLDRTGRSVSISFRKLFF